MLFGPASLHRAPPISDHIAYGILNMEQADAVLREYNRNRYIRHMASKLALRSAFATVTGLSGYGIKAIAHMIYNKASKKQHQKGIHFSICHGTRKS